MTAHPTSEHPVPTPTPEAPTGALTAGQMLQAARLDAGVQLAVLSATLKVPVKQLEALEADQFDPAKGGAAFYRGLTSAICRHLKIDQAPILALLPPSPGHLAAQRSVGLAASPAKPIKMMHASPRKTRSWVLAGAATMLVLIAALLWLPAPSQWVWLEDLKAGFASEGQGDDVAAQEATPAGLPGGQTTDFSGQRDVTEAVASPIPVGMTDEASSATPMAPPVSQSQVSAPLTSTSPAPATAAAAGVPATAPATVPARVNGKAGSAEFVFSATMDSWIELKSGPNTVVWSGLLKAGESRRVDSPLPVGVVVGRAQSVSLTVRGQPFDLKPHTQITVARFEVKE